MRKTRLTIVTALACSAVALTATALGVTRAGATSQAQTDTLVAPLSYEQYLALREPSDIAVCEDYTAIADGNAVYLYDRADGVYRRYEHTVNDDASMNKITKLQFDDNEALYLLDAYNFLYVIKENAFDDFANATPTDTGLACSTFTLHGSWLYFTNVTSGAQLSKVSTENLNKNSAKPLLERSLAGTPALCFWNDELYFTDESFSTHLYKINPNSGEYAEVSRLENAVGMMSVTEGIFACSYSNGDFFSTPLVSLNSESEQVFQTSGSFSALCSFGAYVYAVEGASIRQYDVEAGAFTEYEICANSSSPSRLQGGTDMHLTREKLYIADAGNQRVSIYDTQTNAFVSRFDTLFAPIYITANENTVLVANGTAIALYETDGTLLTTFPDGKFTGEIKGVANVYENYYIVTDQNYYYLLETGEIPVLTETTKTSTRYPKSLTSDTSGFLYTISGKDVFRFTEQAFLTDSEIGEQVFEGLPENTRKLAFDYEQALYALTDNGIYVCTTGETLSLTAPLVYYTDGAPSPTSFTLGVEENATYVLFDGNYIAVSTRLQLPTVKTIAVNGADERVFDNESAQFKIVQTAKNALLVEFDLSKLQGAEHFPYIAYTRQIQPLTALQLGEADGYTLLAVFDENANAYRTYLARDTACNPLPTETYRTDYQEDKQFTGYLTNEVGLYKFPYLSALLTVQTLPREAQVTVLGEITQLDHAYYHVAYKTADGESVTGYIPKVYVNDFDGSPKQSETGYYGAKESNRDELWRLAYLILGFLAVCILTDYLILRKVDKE